MKMTKTKKALLIGVPVLIGVYLIYRQMRGKKTYQEAVIAHPPGTPTSTTTPPADGCGSYKVTTVVSNLNVRQQPNTSSAIISSLPKGSTVSAKASSTSGWMELCSQSGFVSATYLTKQ